MVIDTTVHDRSGLLLSGSPSPTDADINQAELVGIGAARNWLKRTRMNVTNFAFWPRLHREMFGELWTWAGKWRREEKNIGIAPHQIQPELHKLEADLQYWLRDDSTMPRLEVLSRFHHRAVWIHPFDNGNGRWSRLATDAIAVRQYKLDFLTWAKSGDKGDFSPLIAYISERNAGIQD